jgi:hypothetical protein
MRFKLRPSFWGLLFFFVGASAFGYAYPTFFLVRSLAKKHASFDVGKIRSKVSFYQGEGELYRTFNETMVFADGQRVFIRLSSETGGEIALRSRRFGTIADREQDWPFTYDLLFLRDKEVIFDHFKALGFPLKTEKELYWDKEGYGPYRPESNVYFSRFENRAALVLSTEDSSRREGVPQAWFDKDSLLPLRFILPDARIEYRFSREYPLHKNFLYPRSFQVYRNGQLWVKVDTMDVSVGGPAELEPMREKAEVNGDTRDAVGQYFRWVR